MMQQIHIESFTVTGHFVRTTNQVESGPSGKIPLLWQNFFATQPNLNQTIYGVYADYESDATGAFTVTAGIKAETPYAPPSAPNVNNVTMVSGTYLVFPANGNMPEAIIKAWQQVWAHFSEPQAYTRNYQTDFEAYTGPESAAIYIGINI